MFASAAAQQVGWPAYVEPCRKIGPPGLTPERLGDALGDHDPAQREIAAGHALGEHDHVRLDAPALDPEPGAEATEGADHCIDDEQGAGAPAQIGDAFDVSRGGWVHAAGADHRFHEHRRHSLRADPRERLLHLLQRVVAHPDRLVQRSEAHLVAGDTAKRGSEPVGAVICGGAADQHRAVPLADLLPISAGELGRGVDPVAPAGAEEDLRRHRRPLRERLRELQHRRVGEVKKR